MRELKSAPPCLHAASKRAGRYGHMRQRAFVAVLTVLMAIVAGCAGPSAGSGSGPVRAALAPASELTGTWHGSFGLAGGCGGFYLDDANCVLQIREDGTFITKVTAAPASYIFWQRRK